MFSIFHSVRKADISQMFFCSTIKVDTLKSTVNSLYFLNLISNTGDTSANKYTVSHSRGHQTCILKLQEIHILSTLHLS